MILKEIRRQIAEANDIEFITSECRYKGDCLGTCPKCEAEVRYLEQQLQARRLSGKAVVLAGLSAGVIAMSGCGAGRNQASENISPELQGEPPVLVEASLISDDIEEGEVIPEDLREEAQPGVKEGESSQTTAITPDELAIPGEDIPPEENAVFGGSEQMPIFPGGEAKLMEWVKSHIQYPEEALRDSIEGRVIVQFDIKTNGSIDNIDVARGKHPALDAEAIRVVKTLPDFEPGKLHGKIVECRYTLPVTFKLPRYEE